MKDLEYKVTCPVNGCSWQSKGNKVAVNADAMAHYAKTGHAGMIASAGGVDTHVIGSAAPSTRGRRRGPQRKAR